MYEAHCIQTFPNFLGFVAEVRSFCKHNIYFTVQTFKQTLLALVEIAEAEICDEMKLSRGFVMHDAWTCNGTHYVGLFALYNKTINVFLNDVSVQKNISTSTLLTKIVRVQIVKLNLIIVHPMKPPRFLNLSMCDLWKTSFIFTA